MLVRGEARHGGSYYGPWGRPPRRSRGTACTSGAGNPSLKGRSLADLRGLPRVPRRERRNLAEATSERWAPPVFTPDQVGTGAVAALRRWFDLQAGSIWRDLEEELASCSGLVVDVGCGAQPYRALLPPTATYRGIDTVNAAEHFGYEVPDTTYFDGDVWPVEDGRAGTVLATETLEHVLDPVAFLGQAARCLQPGGKLILTVPFAARWHFIPHDYWRFTPSSLRHLLEGSGFTDVTVHARGNAVTVACYKTMALGLPLLFAPGPKGIAGIARRLAGVATLPVTAALSVVANASLLGAGGEDCLGYTVVARRAGDAP